MPAGMLLLPLLLAAPPAPPSFQAVSPDADRPAGPLLRLTADLTATLDMPGKPTTVPDVVSLRRTDLPLPPFPRGPVLISTTGDRIAGKLLGSDGLTLRFHPDFLTGPVPDWNIPSSSVAVLWLTRMPADTLPDPARYPWLAGNRRRDVLLFRNGDAVRGTLEAVAIPLRFTPESGAVRVISLATLDAIAFDPSLARTRRPAGPFAHVVLRDGTRLDLSQPTADRLTLRGTAFGQMVEIPVTDVVAIDIHRGKAAYLSDQTPARAEQAGFLGVAWPWVADRTVRGRPLRVLGTHGEETHDKGLGTHPKTTLRYTLGGKYTRFEALVGLDPDTGSRGRAAVRVLVDGKEQPLPALRSLMPGPAVPVRVNVRGARELTLEIDFGPTGGVQADVNWADARLIR